MSCGGQLELLLQSYLDGELAAPEQAELEQHLSTCSPCLSTLHREEQLRRALYAHVQSATPKAPSHLRKQIISTLAQADKSSPLLRYAPWATAAAVLAIAGAGATWSRRQHQRFLEDAALRHARSLPMEISQAPAQKVEAWFWGKLDHHVPVLQLPNAKLTGARLSNVQDHPAAYLIYDAAARPGEAPRRIGLFVFDDSSGEVGAKPLPAVEVAQSRGYNVAVWRDGEIVYQLVTDLGEAEIRRLLQPPQPAVPPPSAVPASLQVQPAALEE